VLLVYLVAGYFLLASLIRRSRNSKERIPARSKLLARTSFGLAALGTLCIGYSFCEPYRPEVTHVTIVSPKLAKAAKSLRIVHISDLHSDPKPRLEDRLPAIISSQHPDFIVFTGDSANSLDGVPVFRRLMSNLASIAPTFVVKGNWDQWPGSSERLFDGTGVAHLDGYAIRREFGGTQFGSLVAIMDALLGQVIYLCQFRRTSSACFSSIFPTKSSPSQIRMLICIVRVTRTAARLRFLFMGLSLLFLPSINSLNRVFTKSSKQCFM
jgi:hypothetical protein